MFIDSSDSDDGWVSSVALVTERPGVPSKLTVIGVKLPGPDEVMIHVEAVGLCHTDLSLMSGRLRDEFPLVAGHEVCGVVAAIGSDVRGLAIGERVVIGAARNCGLCKFCAGGHPMLCGQRLLQRGRLRLNGHEVSQGFGIGGFSELTVVAAAGVVPVGDGIEPEVAALVGCSVATGAGAVLRLGELRPGQRLAVVGVGGIGMSAVLAGLAGGASFVGVVEPRSAGRERAQQLGADETWASVDIALASGVEPFDLVVEASGNEVAMGSAIGIVAPAGRLVVTGIPGPGTGVTFDTQQLVIRQITVSGCLTGDLVAQVDIPRYLDLYRRGRLPIDSLLGQVVPFEDSEGLFGADRRTDEGRTVIRLGSKES